jgi:hypothetical protein
MCLGICVCVWDLFQPPCLKKKLADTSYMSQIQFIQKRILGG